MNETYIVTATGTKDGKAYSTLSRIVHGTKDNGDKYTFIDTKNHGIREQEELPFGEIIEYQTSRVKPKA